MAVINRCAVGIAPRTPLIAWSQQVSGVEGMSWEENDHSLYLLPSYEDEQDRDRILARNAEQIFHEELTSWCTDQSLWPSPLSLALFHEWFEVRFYELVEDLGEEPIRVESLDPEFLDQVRAALRTP
ncbi:MAG: hypothetical protein ACKO0M_03420 [Cyanobium sp.]